MGPERKEKSYIAMSTAEGFYDIDADKPLFAADLEEYEKNMVKVALEIGQEKINPDFGQVAIQLGATEDRARKDMGEVKGFYFCKVLKKRWFFSSKFLKRWSSSCKTCSTFLLHFAHGHHLPHKNNWIELGTFKRVIQR